MNAEWPPRVQALPEHPLAPRKDVTLEAPPVPEASFAAGRLAAQDKAPRSQPGADVTHEPAQAVVFDPRNPSGRTRADALFDVKDEDLERALRTARQKAALTGTMIFVLILLSFTPFAWSRIALGAAIGSAAGIAALSWTDGPGSWCLCCAFGSLTLLPLISGPFIFVIIGAAGASGWLMGLLRDET